jgi:two-component system OmpR family sensor kinase
VTVLGDELRLRQVAANLLANTRQHTPPSTPVTVSARRAGDVAVLEVADAGPGLTPDQATRVFERFYRADPSRARSMGGTGLGLSIVAAVAEAHGGAARVVSTPGAGARFWVEIPLSAASTAPEAPAATAAPTTGFERPVEELTTAPESPS